MTILPSLPLGFTFSEVFAFELPSETNLGFSSPSYSSPVIARPLPRPTNVNTSSQGKFRFLKTLRSAIIPNFNNNSVTNDIIQKGTIIAVVNRQSAKHSYIRINGLARFLVLLVKLIPLVNFISFNDTRKLLIFREHQYLTLLLASKTESINNLQRIGTQTRE